MQPPLTIGILSDTHLTQPTETFRRLVAVCFAEADLILHAGDLVDISVLAAFGPKEVIAVRGNMCRGAAAGLDRQRVITVGDHRIGLIHHTGRGYDFEDQLANVFDEPVDCIVYGHTHRPVCRRYGPVLYLNPGSFLPGQRFGASGTYGLLTVGRQLTGRILPTPSLTDLPQEVLR